MQSLFLSLRQTHRGITLALAILILLALTTRQAMAPGPAQSAGGYDLTWNSVDGGGDMFSTGGSYSLGATIGQADAGTFSGANYMLIGGFWGNGNLLQQLHLPLISR